MPVFSYGSLPMIIIGFLVAGCGTAWAVFSAYKFATIRWQSGRFDLLYVVEFIAALYPIGLGFKLTVMGPEFLRWHLADIGFPVFIGAFLFRRYWQGFAKDNASLQRMTPAEQSELYFRYKRNVLLVALFLSYVYEFGVGLLYFLRPELPAFMVGKTDWQDLAYYTLGAAVAYVCLSWYVRALRELRSAAQTLAEASQRREHEAQQERARTERAQPRRKSRGARRKR